MDAGAAGLWGTDSSLVMNEQLGWTELVERQADQVCEARARRSQKPAYQPRNHERLTSARRIGSVDISPLLTANQHQTSRYQQWALYGHP